MKNEIKKSINFEITGVRGITSLGKYTFVSILDELNKLPVELINAPEKYIQGTSPV